jgi:hypothetical protein
MAKPGLPAAPCVLYGPSAHTQAACQALSYGRPAGAPPPYKQGRPARDPILLATTTARLRQVLNHGKAATAPNGIRFSA